MGKKRDNPQNNANSDLYELASSRGKHPQLRDSIGFSWLKIAEEGFSADEEDLEKTK